ncbi:cell division cycle protein 123 [Kipferlia bialata]|uniref:Cell division cycle protein 123 n=1 Tax=Kipferlia bialata TaxID=797122 RepID=A0A9K3D1F5_9EUKA|nr:cell division cycle protein 123 [Kipferlia bialata]|eukprot:g7594.t1
MTEEEAPCPPLLYPTRAEVDACAYPNWPERVKLNGLDATVIPIDRSGPAYAWLLSDGIDMTVIDRWTKSRNPPEDSDSEDTETQTQTQAEAEAEAETDHPAVYELFDTIEATIKKYDGTVFTKTDWSSARDVSWIYNASNGLRACTVEDVVLYLKSSDFITHDLMMPYDGCVDVEEGDVSLPPTVHLVLKQFYDLRVANEVRVFVKDGKVLAMCQRQSDVFFAHLLEEEEWRHPMVEKVHKFMGERMLEPMQSVGLDKFVCDLYVTPGQGYVRVIDVNPWHPATCDAGLYTWEELHTLSLSPPASPCDMRVVESQAGIVDTRVLSSGFPLEMTQGMMGVDGMTLDDLVASMKECNMQ